MAHLGSDHPSERDICVTQLCHARVSRSGVTLRCHAQASRSGVTLSAWRVWQCPQGLKIEESSFLATLNRLALSVKR